MKRSTRNRIKWIAALALAALAAAFILGAYHHRSGDREKAQGQAEEVLTTMKKLIPGLGTVTEASSSAGRDPLPAMSIDGIDVIGCLQISSLDIMTPVTSKETGKAGFVAYVEGSPANGQLRLRADRHGVFAELEKAAPGDRVLFTDVDGVRYAYTVVTQYHLKDWAEADNDLLLCYEVDENTDFVLGCNTEE